MAGTEAWTSPEAIFVHFAFSGNACHADSLEAMEKAAVDKAAGGPATGGGWLLDFWLIAAHTFGAKTSVPVLPFCAV